MFNRPFFLLAQTSVRRYNRSNAHGLEAPRTRRSVLEPLEDRALLAVASVPVGHDVYCVAAPIQNAPIKPISLDSLKAEIETTASDASNEIVFNLVDVSNAVIEEETAEDDSFIVDGKRFESYEALRVKHLVFPNGGASDDSDDFGMNPRSGGSGGSEPETWDIEVTTSFSSLVSDLSGTYTNPLVEHRCGSGGATPLTNSDYENPG